VLRPGQGEAEEVKQSDQHRLVDQVNRQRVSAKGSKRLHEGGPRQIRQGDPAPVATIKEISQGDAYQDHPEPGKEGKVVQGIEALRSQPQPEQPGIVDAEILQI